MSGNGDEGQLGESVQSMRLRSSYIVLAGTLNWPQIDNRLVLKRKKTKDHRGQNRRRGWSRSIIDQHHPFTPANNDQVLNRISLSCSFYQLLLGLVAEKGRGSWVNGTSEKPHLLDADSRKGVSRTARFSSSVYRFLETPSILKWRLR